METTATASPTRHSLEAPAPGSRVNIGAGPDTRISLLLFSCRSAPFLASGSQDRLWTSLWGVVASQRIHCKALTDAAALEGLVIERRRLQTNSRPSGEQQHGPGLAGLRPTQAAVWVWPQAARGNHCLCPECSTEAHIACADQQL